MTYDKYIAKPYMFKKRLIPMLQEIQKLKGYLPKEDLLRVSEKLKIPLSEVYGVATFYHQFSLEKPGKFTIWLCMGTACHIKGNSENHEVLKNLLGLKPGQKTSKDGLFTVEKARCFGCCSLAPVIKINNELFGYVTPKKLRTLITRYKARAKEIKAEIS